MTLPVALDRWNARLSLAFARHGPRTTLVRNEHAGPLVVQKALYPEGAEVCQAIILHPPGGIAGGDHLEIDVEAGDSVCNSVCNSVDERAIAQLTTPGATKWYKANGRSASQDVRIAVHGRSIVEWLPLENIVFDGAVASTSLSVDVDAGGSAAGWDIVAYGRSAAGERFDCGQYRQSVELRREGALVWAETGAVNGSDPLFASAVGFAGRSVTGLLWVMFPAMVPEGVVDACRDIGTRMSQSFKSLAHGVTSLHDESGTIVLVRCLAESTEIARSYLSEVWTTLRPCYAQRAASSPRLWMT